MSNVSWSDSLSQALTALRRNNQPPRVAVVGVGHELRGDDAAGVWVAHTLKPVFAGDDHVLIVDGGHAPENHTGVLRRFAPNLVLLVDTARMGEPPGTVRWLVWQETSGMSASTHAMPPYMIAWYLTTELGCEVALIGIQPLQTTFGEGLSPATKKSVYEVVELLVASLNAKNSEGASDES